MKQSQLFEDEDDEFIDDLEEDPKKIDEVYVDADLLDVLKIDDLALDEEFIRFSRDLAYWNAKYSRAIKRHLLLQHRFEKTRARLWLETKNSAIAEGNKLTVDDLKCEVVLREEYEEAFLKMVDADVTRQKLKRDVDNLMGKKDMLQSLGAKLRTEMEGDPSVRRQHREAREYGTRE